MAVRLLGLLVRVWNATLRFRIDPVELKAALRSERPVLLVLWHNRILTACGMERRYRYVRPIHGMVSASKDGAYLAAFFDSVGIRPVRGSSSRRGIAAARELLAVLRAGGDVAITPDGPRGPMYALHEGAAMLAMVSGAPLLIMMPNFEKAWRVNAWDGFYLPRPFSRVRMRSRLIEPGELPRDREACGTFLRNAMLELTDDLPAPPRARQAAPQAGHPDVVDTH
jgi:hypothetical protein